MKKFNYIVCGGTFDHLHDGHKKFLRFTFSMGRHIVLGLTTEKYINKYKSKEKIEPFGVRKKTLISFIKKESMFENVEIMPIDDISSPFLLSKEIKTQAIVVTKQTVKGAESINFSRKKIGLKAFEIIICPFKKTDDNKLISSTRIRKGEIQRDGNYYINQSFLKNDFVITEEFRRKLKKPFGKLLKGKEYLKEEMSLMNLITIGDVTTKALNDISFNHLISVIDMHVARKKQFMKIEDLGFETNTKIIQAINPASHITFSLIKAIKKALNFSKLNKRVVIVVSGEEDLSVIPFIILAPLGFKLLYGQPGKGIVLVEVNEKTKQRACLLLKSFNRSYPIISLTRGH